MLRPFHWSSTTMMFPVMVSPLLYPCLRSILPFSLHLRVKGFWLMIADLLSSLYAIHSPFMLTSAPGMSKTMPL